MNNIDYNTIISSFDDKGTLLKWLKTIDAELKGSKVTSSSWRVVEGEESNTAYLTLTTSDGVNFETEGLVMPKTTSAIIIDVIDKVINQYSTNFKNLSQLAAGVDEIIKHIGGIEATEGQVLTANGDGTSAWKNPSGGGGESYSEIDITSIISGGVLRPTASTYAKIKYSENMLYLVISGKMIANSSVTSSDELLIYNGSINLPSNIASKIFRADGTALNQNPSSTTELNTLINSGSYALINASGTRSSDGFIVKSDSANTISLRLYKITTISGQNNTCDLRMFLTL